jgi:5-methylcytosine-specific restriction endonuclease McrA
MTAEERRAYNRAWMERKRRSQGVLSWAEHPKQLMLPFPKSRVRLSVNESRERHRWRYIQEREERISYQRGWAKANPEKVRVSRSLGNRTRQARIRASRIGKVSLRHVLKRDGWRCGICGQPIESRSLRDVHFDHIVPLSKGGTHTEDNIQVAHPRCNLRKHSKAPPIALDLYAPAV